MELLNFSKEELIYVKGDTFGLFGTQPIKFDFTKPLGVIVMIIGIIIFKFRG